MMDVVSDVPERLIPKTATAPALSLRDEEEHVACIIEYLRFHRVVVTVANLREILKPLETADSC